VSFEKIGEYLARKNITTVYHLAAVFNGFTEMGVSVVAAPVTQQAGRVGQVGYRANWTLGVPRGEALQEPGSNDVRTFPCQGTTEANATFAPITESPNPLPDVGSGVVGTPIMISGRQGATLEITSHSVRAANAASAVATRVLRDQAIGTYRQRS
jgi:hypothetical protein